MELPKQNRSLYAVVVAAFVVIVTLQCEEAPIGDDMTSVLMAQKAFINLLLRPVYETTSSRAKVTQGHSRMTIFTKLQRGSGKSTD